MPNIPVIPANYGTVASPGGVVADTALPGTFIVQKSDNSYNMVPNAQVCSSTADAVTFTSPINVAIFTSTGPDTATLATPGASDVGKVLILVNTNTTQNTCATAAGKIRNGSAAGATLTAPATAGAVALLVASNGFWNMVVGGTGSWVLS